MEELVNSTVCRGELQQALKVGGHLGDDHGGYVQYFEQLADVTVKKVE